MCEEIEESYLDKKRKKKKQKRKERGKLGIRNIGW